MQSTETNQPIVSIGLLVYNGENFLREALDSLLGQTFENFELIISDNASTDLTAQIVKDYQRADSRIQYFRQNENIGPGANFLFVLDQAKADYFMWASHDDVWAKNWLEVLVENLTQEDMGVRGELFLKRGEEIVAKKRLPDFAKRDFVRCFLRNETDYRSHYTYSLFHRKKIQALDFTIFDMDYYADAVLIYAMLDLGSLRTIKQTCLWYRLHDDNFGIGYSKRWRSWRKFLYRIHPFRYYGYYLQVTKQPEIRRIIMALIPLKHLYCQVSFWLRGMKQIITGKETI